MNVLGYDPLIPAVTSVVDSPSSGELTIGKSVTITLVFNTVVAVTGGTPTLSLNDDGVATFVGGSGTQALTFSYTISATDKNVTALSVAEFNLDGASIADVVGTDANLSLAGLSQSGPQIYIPPIVTQIAEIYEAVLQRAPSTDEVNAAIAEEGAIGNAGVVAILVDSPEAQQNIYPVVQIIDLATGSLPAAAQLTGWVLEPNQETRSTRWRPRSAPRRPLATSIIMERRSIPMRRSPPVSSKPSSSMQQVWLRPRNK